MICEPCKRGGDLTQAANDPAASPVLVAMSRFAAFGHHVKCAGGTWCDCQHVVGKALRGASDGNQ